MAATPVEVNNGTFKSVKQLRGELDRVLKDNGGRDLPLKNSVGVNLAQQGDQFVFVRLTSQE